jgi:uncharacterized membrane protein YhfC
MTVFWAIVALLGLLIFVVGAAIFLFRRPTEPSSTFLMVIGALVFAVSQVVILFDSIF